MTTKHRKRKPGIRQLLAALFLVAAALLYIACRSGWSGSTGWPEGFGWPGNISQGSAGPADAAGNPAGAAITEGPDLLSGIEAWRGLPFVVLNGNVPSFSPADLTAEQYQSFSPLDSLARTGAGTARLTRETMPKERRGPVDYKIRPTGWHTVRYDELIEDHYLYNRCHVIAWQLGGDGSTPENLFTGTRYLNTESMLYFENKVASDLRSRRNACVLYRVTPVYRGNNLLSSGVQMEAWSVDDAGRSICFNVFLYNVQPGVEIRYSDGESRRAPAGTAADVISCEETWRMLTGN